MHKYLVIIEKGEASYGAHSPDLPGCIAVGDTAEEVEARMLEAMKDYLQLLSDEGHPVPVPTTTTAFLVALEPPRPTVSAA
jgi:predicted RNase H-like HicB family nuclease